MDDGYETGTTTTSAPTSTKSHSPHRSSSTSSAAGQPRSQLTHKRSVGSSSLPSPALVTDEARRVLEAFLQRSQSIDRGSTSSVAAMLPRHLEVIQEIRHTCIRTESYHAATVDGETPAPPSAPPGAPAALTDDDDGDGDDDSVDAVVVSTRLGQHPPDVTIEDVAVRHRHRPGEPHTTDVDVTLTSPGPNSVPRVVHTHRVHPPLPGAGLEECAALAVTTGNSEVFIDASLSRQQSQTGEPGPEAAQGDSPDPPGAAGDAASPLSAGVGRATPSSRAYEADGERWTPGQAVDAPPGPAEGAEGKKKKKKRKRGVETIRTWLRNLRPRLTGEEEEDGMAETPGSEWGQRPKFFTMESTSSTTSTSTFGGGSGATARSIVRRDDKPMEGRKKKKRLRRRASFGLKQQSAEDGLSFFHQLFRLRLRRRDSEPPVHCNSTIIADMLAQQEMQYGVRPDTADSPDSEQLPYEQAIGVNGVAAGFAVEGAESMPELDTQDVLEEHQAVGEIFRNAIDKRDSSGSGIMVDATSSAMVKRVHLSPEDVVDAAVTHVSTAGETVTKQVDRETLRLDLGSSSNSGSSNSHSRVTSSGGAMQLSSPDALGPDGVATASDVDKVARLLDRMADDLNDYFSRPVGAGEHPRGAAANGRRRFSLPDNSPSKAASGVRRERPGSARNRGAVSECTPGAETGPGHSECAVSSSTSTPLLGLPAANGDEFDPQRALRAKASRMKHQSSECLVSDQLVEALVNCEQYSEFEHILAQWFPSGRRGGGSSWRQIALLYHLARKLVRRMESLEYSDERLGTMKDFILMFFSHNFADFVLRRGGWRNLIEDTEDSELD